MVRLLTVCVGFILLHHFSVSSNEYDSFLLIKLFVTNQLRMVASCSLYQLSFSSYLMMKSDQSIETMAA